MSARTTTSGVRAAVVLGLTLTLGTIVPGTDERSGPQAELAPHLLVDRSGVQGAAGGRLYLATTDGKVLCLAGR